MKLVLAIVNNDDSAVAAASLTAEGYFVTRLSTTGGFLMVGNTTLLIGTEDDGVDKVLEILKKHCVTRRQMATPVTAFGKGMRADSLPAKVKVGGATVFVLNVESYEKL
ncbi:MAG: cyclic-di-AMP receptor [Clostridia bacterium]|nr:cyclic-di-AMP receptor [Clostridia bacterium]MBQ4297440.1 cyclic-di-AMP receptor [Clostridia bacterium]